MTKDDDPRPTDRPVPRLGQVAIPVEDVARATAFYRDVVGLPFLFAAPPGLAFFDGGGVRLMLSRPEGEGGAEPPGSLLYYQVDDLDGTHERFVAEGVDVVEAPHVVHRTEGAELWMAAYHDTEGNMFLTMTERTG